MQALQASLAQPSAGGLAVDAAAAPWRPNKGASVVLPRMGNALATVVTPAPDGALRSHACCHLPT